MTEIYSWKRAIQYSTESKDRIAENRTEGSLPSRGIGWNGGQRSTESTSSGTPCRPPKTFDLFSKSVNRLLRYVGELFNVGDIDGKLAHLRARPWLLRYVGELLSDVGDVGGKLAHLRSRTFSGKWSRWKWWLCPYSTHINASDRLDHQLSDASLDRFYRSRSVALKKWWQHDDEELTILKRVGATFCRSLPSVALVVKMEFRFEFSTCWAGIHLLKGNFASSNSAFLRHCSTAVLNLFKPCVNYTSWRVCATRLAWLTAHWLRVREVATQFERRSMNDTRLSLLPSEPICCGWWFGRKRRKTEAFERSWVFVPFKPTGSQMSIRTFISVNMSVSREFPAEIYLQSEWLPKCRD